MSRTEILNKSVARTVILLLFLLSTFYCIWAANQQVGSNTQPSREAFWPLSGTGNVINGFAGLYNGFSLSNAATAVTFSSRYPVGTFIGLNGGTLTLLQDLFLDSNLTFGSPGIIIGNNHDVAFAPQNQTIPLPLLSQLNLLSSKKPGGYPAATGWSPDGQYVASGAQSNIYSFNGLSLTLAVSAAGINPNALAWQPGLPPSYYFVAAGFGLYAYQFIPPAAVSSTSNINTGTWYEAVCWHPAGNIVAASQTSFNTQQVQVFNFNAGILTPNTSYSFADTTQMVQYRALAFDYSGKYLAVGCSNANQLQIFYWDGISLQSTASANTGQVISALCWSPDGSLIAAGGPTGLQVYRLNRTVNSLTLIPSYGISTSSNFWGLDWSPDGRTIAAIFRGSFSPVLYFVNYVVQKLFNIGIYTLGGYGYQIKWSPNGLYLLTGDSSATLSVLNFSGTMPISNTNLVFNSPVQLRSGIVCSGICTIDGNGYTLDLNSQIITVTTGASLSFNNVVLEGFTGTNLQCIDSTGTVSFRDTTCVVNNTMQWSQGSMAIIGGCIMTGTGTFTYSSGQSSTIYSNATWYFDRGMTFSYYPQSGVKNLINFADNTAELYLYETAVRAQPMGLQFTKGTLAIDGRCPFYSAASTPASGILFGDGLTGANNVNLMILPESGIDCRSGYVVDQNIGS